MEDKGFQNVVKGGVDMDDILQYLNAVCLYELNDSNTRENFELAFPNIKCDNSMNTPKVIDMNCVRFIYDNKLYEYKGLNDLVEVEND